MNFYKDNVIKLEYNPVLEQTVARLNAIGATDSLTLRSLDITPSDTNSIFVSDLTGNDSTGDGTQSNPVKTIVHADSLLSSSKNYIIITDSEDYTEVSHAFSSNCKGIFAALGQKPTVKPDLVPRSSSNYLVDTLKSTTAISANSVYTSYPGFFIEALSNGNCVVVYNIYGDTTYTIGHFQIVDKDGNIIVSDTVYETTYFAVGGVVALRNGTFVIVYKISSGDWYYKVFTNDGNLLYTGLCPGGGNNYSIGEFGGYDDRFVFTYVTGSNTGFAVVDTEGTVQISPSTLISSFSCVYGGRIKARPGGGFIYSLNNAVSEGSGIYNKWGVVSVSGSILHSGQFGGGAVYVYGTDFVTYEDSLFFIYNSGNNVILEEYILSDYSIIRAATTIATESGSSISNFRASLINNNAISVSYTGSSTYKLLVISLNCVTLFTETLSTVLNIKSVFNPVVERLYISGYNSSSNPVINIKGGFLTDWWTFSSDITLNGLTFNNIEDYIYRFLYSSSGVFKVKWCNFLNIAQTEYKDEDTYPLYIATVIGSDIQILNSKSFNNDAGFKLTGNSVLVQYCQFFKHLLNPAVYITGAGAGVIVNHCDFLYNYIPVKLAGNNGSEIIKNSIFFQSLTYSIYADVAVTYKNSINNIPGYNAAAGEQVIMSNPHYVNDGYISVDDIDLRLKSRELGFTIDSPAIGIGDDLLDAGSEYIIITGATQTWTAITVQKDMENGVQLYEDVVGNIETELSDGDVDTYRDAFTEVLKLAWRACLLTDFNNLKSLYHCKNNIVRVYLDPVSDPSVYGTYKVIYDKFNKFTKHPKLSRTGIEDVSLTFKRAYSEGA